MVTITEISKVYRADETQNGAIPQSAAGAQAQGSETSTNTPATNLLLPSPEEVRSMNIHERISWVMRESRSLPRAQWNPEGNFYYAGHDQIIEMLRELMAKYGVNIYQEGVEYEREPSLGGIGHYTLARFRYDVVNIHKPSDHFRKFHWGEAWDDGDKGLNKCSTVSEKVFLLRLFKIATFDDPDAIATAKKNPEAAPLPSSGKRGGGKPGHDSSRTSPTNDCEACAQPICTALRKGKKWHASEVVALSRKQFQKKLCVDCLLKAQEKANPGDRLPGDKEPATAPVLRSGNGLSRGSHE